MREVSEKSARGLKAVTRHGLDLVGGPESFQHMVRVSQGQLSKYASLNEEYASSFMPIDIALEVDLAAGVPVILAAMARLEGYRLEKDDAPPPAETLTHRDINILALEFGDVQRAVHEALEDDHIDSGERRRIKREAGELLRAISLFIEKLGD